MPAGRRLTVPPDGSTDRANCQKNRSVPGAAAEVPSGSGLHSACATMSREPTQNGGRSSEFSWTALQQAVERMHDCKARVVGITTVLERCNGKTVWEGKVYIFALEGHPAADRAYAWYSPIDGAVERRHFVVLQTAPIRSAWDAVRSAVVRDHMPPRR